jgi:glutaredoxin-related protein
MKFATFHYKDLKGKETDRKVLLMDTPSNKYVGLDVSELDDEDIATFAAEYDYLLDEFMESVANLKEQYDLKYNHRQFLETGVSDLEVTTI